MKKYMSLVALVLACGNLFGSQSSKNKKTRVAFSDHLVVCRYNDEMPIARDNHFLWISSQGFDLYHTTAYTKDELLQDASFRKKFLAFMGCTPHFTSPYSEKSK